MWFPCLDLLLWVLAVTAWVFEDEEEFAWIAGEAAFVTRALRIDSAEELEGVLRGFVYPTSHFGGVLERLWVRVQG